jgi:hypothetical protein
MRVVWRDEAGRSQGAATRPSEWPAWLRDGSFAQEAFPETFSFDNRALPDQIIGGAGWLAVATCLCTFKAASVGTDWVSPRREKDRCLESTGSRSS